MTAPNDPNDLPDHHRIPSPWLARRPPYDPNNPTGGGNFNPDMRIDTSQIVEPIPPMAEVPWPRDAKPDPAPIPPTTIPSTPPPPPPPTTQIQAGGWGCRDCGKDVSQSYYHWCA